MRNHSGHETAGVPHALSVSARWTYDTGGPRRLSEYQYYEFQAIDRPLTKEQMDELRSYSTRARITRTSFINDYSWGRFKGDEDAWMEHDGIISPALRARAELARGDLRALYLGWLLCVQHGELDDEDIEPVVPPGLEQLSESLESLISFLRIDKDLLTDLRDLAQRDGKEREFRTKLEPIHAAHARKPSFLERLRKAAL
jgi:hypothetical protein